MSLSYRYGDDPYYVSSDYEKGANDARAEDTVLLHDVYEALSCCEDYLDNKADADFEDGQHVPNDEMALLVHVRAVLAKLEKRI